MRYYFFIMALLAFSVPSFSFSLFGNEPRFIFELGSSLESFQKDPRFKKCTIAKNTPYKNSNNESITNWFDCKNVENTDQLLLTFYHKKLIGIMAHFKEFSDQGSLLAITSTSPEEDRVYREKYLGLFQAVTDVCKKVGPLQIDEEKSKTIEGRDAKTGASTGVFYQNFMQNYSDKKKFSCKIGYQKRTTTNGKMVGKWWTFAELVALVNTEEMEKVNAEIKNAEKADVEKGKKKYNF